MVKVRRAARVATGMADEHQKAAHIVQPAAHAVRLRPAGHNGAAAVLALQRSVGNRAVQRLLQRTAAARAQLTRPAAMMIQRWIEYSTAYAEKLADKGFISIFDDRLDHVIERHGPKGSASGSTFHRFYTDDKKVIRGYIQTALTKGSVTRSPGQAFDFEKTFTEAIGEDTDGDKAMKIRVVVVQMGKRGDRGKVQTAYPIP